MGQQVHLQALNIVPWRRRQLPAAVAEPTAISSAAIYIVLTQSELSAKAHTLLKNILNCLGQDFVQAQVITVEQAAAKADARYFIVFGEAAAQALLAIEYGLEAFHQQAYRFQDKPVFVLQHPDVLLQQPFLKQQVYDTLKRILAEICASGVS